jgi:hypothetical protein
MKVKLIAIVFLLKVVPSMAQKEKVSDVKQTDTISSKQAKIGAAGALSTAQILEIQKNTLKIRKKLKKSCCQTRSKSSSKVAKRG